MSDAHTSAVIEGAADVGVSCVELNGRKSKLKVTQNYGPAAAARAAAAPPSVNLFSFAASALLRVWRRNTKEAACCVTLSLELFKEHAAARLHANATVTLVSLSAAAAAALTFRARPASFFFSGERKLCPLQIRRLFFSREPSAFGWRSCRLRNADLFMRRRRKDE